MNIVPNTYEYFSHKRVIFGKPLAESVSEELDHHDARKVFVISTRSLSQKTDVVSQLQRVLGNKFGGLFDQVVSHVPRAVGIAATEHARSIKPDLIISIGGGSAIDTGKLVQICLAENIKTTEELDRFRVVTDSNGASHVPTIKTSGIRQLVIPTTLSGAEWSHTTGSTDDERGIKDIYIQSDLAAPGILLVPEILKHTPLDIWLTSGFRGVDHAIGSLVSKNAHPFTNSTTAEGLRMLNRSLRATKNDPDNVEHRFESLIALWLASTGMMRMQYGASHGLSWHLSAVADVAHGHCSCVLIPATLRFNKAYTIDAQRQISEILGQPDVEAADAVLDLIRALDLPEKMREVGIRREHLGKIANDAMGNLLVRNNCRPITSVDDVMEILEMAF